VPKSDVAAEVSSAREALTVRRLVVAIVMVAALALAPDVALGAWSGSGSGSGYSKARSMPVGNTPSATVSGRNVTVSWSASSFSGGPAVSGYVLKRYDGSGNQQTIGASCAGTIPTVSCTESAVPAGSWRYTVTPKQGSWTGAESALSSAVTVVAPTLSLAPTPVTSLPSTLSGSIAGFVAGQSVSFRLDDPQSGPALTGSISPSPVQSSGSASVSVTIPVGTSNGTHTVYAVGSAGDTASAAISVGVPSFVRNLGQASCGATSMTVTIPAAGVAANDTVILRLMLRGTTSGAVSASDSKGNSYTSDKDVLSSNQRVVVLRARATTALVAGNTISVTYPTSSAAGLAADDFTGIAANPVDGSGQGSGNSATPSASVTTTNVPDVVVGAVSIAGLQAAPVQPSGWSALTGQSLTCSNTSASVGGYRIASSTGSYTYNPTGLVSGRWADAIVAYKAG
jgi:hypothetical protein